jgi:hypothetical protein
MEMAVVSLDRRRAGSLMGQRQSIVDRIGCADGDLDVLPFGIRLIGDGDQDRRRVGDRSHFEPLKRQAHSTRGH